MRVSCVCMIALLALLSSGNIGAQDSTSKPKAKPSFSIEIAAVYDTVKIGSPIVVKMTLTNISDHELKFWNSAKGPYCVEVRDSKGKIPPETDMGFELNGHAKREDVVKRVGRSALDFNGVAVPLKPGEKWPEQFDVRERYNLTQPGKYTVYVRRELEESYKYVMSNEITVTLTE
jgi:hypothetical protein